MAYSARFNPDALPPHAEPEEAAQLLANARAASAKVSPSIDPSTNTSTTSSSSYENRPPPPLPTASSSSTTITQQYPPHHRPASLSNASGTPQNQAAFRPAVSAKVSSPPLAQHSPPNNTSPWPAPLNLSSHPTDTYATSSATTQHPAGPQTLTSSQAHPFAGQRPHSPLPPAGTPDPSLWPLFRAVDTHARGRLSQAELSSALKNDEYTAFDSETVRLMIKMFDSKGRGTIGYEEFCGLWGFLAAWRTLFQRFDTDRSGFISYSEYANALIAFGYHLSSEFVGMMYRMYDRRGNERMTFDLFVQSCIQLKRMTDVFKRYDVDRDGYITLSFEEFLTEILSMR